MGRGHHGIPRELFSNIVMSWLSPRTPMFSHDGAPKMNQNKSKSGMENQPVLGWYDTGAQARVTYRSTRKSTPVQGKGSPKTASLEFLLWPKTIQPKSHPCQPLLTAAVTFERRPFKLSWTPWVLWASLFLPGQSLYPPSKKKSILNLIMCCLYVVDSILCPATPGDIWHFYLNF